MITNSTHIQGMINLAHNIWLSMYCYSGVRNDFQMVFVSFISNIACVTGQTEIVNPTGSLEKGTIVGFVLRNR